MFLPTGIFVYVKSDLKNLFLQCIAFSQLSVSRHPEYSIIWDILQMPASTWSKIQILQFQSLILIYHNQNLGLILGLAE